MEWNAYTIWTIEYIFKWSIIDLNLFFYCSKFISKECWWSCNLNLEFAFWCIVYFLLCIIFILELCWILTILCFWNVNCLHCWNTTSKIPFLLCKRTLCFFPNWSMGMQVESMVRYCWDMFLETIIKGYELLFLLYSLSWVLFRYLILFFEQIHSFLDYIIVLIYNVFRFMVQLLYLFIII